MYCQASLLRWLHSLNDGLALIPGFIGSLLRERVLPLRMPLSGAALG